MSYTPNTDADKKKMLAAIGLDSVDELFADIPAGVRNPKLNVPRPMAEMELMDHMREMAGKNRDLQDVVSFLGAGWYDHYVPAFVDQLLLRSEFYTSYTPYQSEISQGTLQAVYEFQSLICDLTGLDVANASMYDAGSALAEAVSMAIGATGRRKVVVADTVDPTYREIVQTYTETLYVDIQVVRNWRLDRAGTIHDEPDALVSAVKPDVACLVLQRPSFFGTLERNGPAIAAAREAGAMVIVVADPVPLGVLKPPGEIGADVAVGELRHLAGPPAFGGPGAGYFATTQNHLRHIPGRIVGQTADVDGRRGFVLTLQAREQHIRRERASSNICTNQALVALGATMHLAALGKNGLRRLAELCVQNAHACASAAWPAGFRPAAGDAFVREFPLSCPRPGAEINARLLDQGIVGGFELSAHWPELDHHMLLAFTERTAGQARDKLISALGGTW